MFSKDQSLFPTHRKLPIRAAANVIRAYRLTNRNFLPATESAIIRDRELPDNIIAVVIRDFAKDYYDIIKPWAVDLIKNSIDRRTLSQRNGPGKLAKVGVTDGPRNARVFGWSRSLKKKFRRELQNDHDEHERNI